jgi:hypothetical protein
VAFAQEEPEAEDPNTGGLSVSGGVDYTTAYFFRGYNQEDTGLILQPYATITGNVVDGDDVDVNAYVAIWNSFHEEKTGFDGTGGPSTWYESDLYGGIDVVAGPVTVGVVYTFYTYPNGAFDTIQEVGAKVAFDDTSLWGGEDGGFALKPYAGVYLETKDGNGSEDTYAEVGVSPSFALGETGMTLSVPAALGLSLDDYYFDDAGDDELLGYGSVGLFGSLPLPMPAKYGAWSLIGGVQYIHLFADGLEAANDGGEDNEILGKVGVNFVY